jgi:hypothetical protein
MKTTLAAAICLWVLACAAWSDEVAPAEQKPSERTTEREKQLKAGIAGFQLELTYIGPQDKPFYNLTLSVQPVAQLASDPFHPIVQIDQAQAEKIVRQLAADGFLDRAIDDQKQDITLRAPKGPTYFLTVRAQDPTFGRMQWHEDLGWNGKMLDRLDSLKNVLDPKPAAALDLLLGRLGGQRREWKQESK